MKPLMSLLTLLGLLALYLLFWPIPINAVAWNAPTNTGYIGQFSENNILSSVEVISLQGEEGPEDLAVNANGDVFFSLLSGKIMKIDSNNQLTEFSDTKGRPLGIEFNREGDLLVADAFRGLLSISPIGQVTLLTDTVGDSPIRYADDVDIANNGMVYFTDASTKFPAKAYGTYAASLLDIMEHGGHGRVLSYNPTTKETKLVLSGLQFANGISVTHEQDSLLVNETGTYSVIKYWLSGSKAGQSEYILKNLPGFPDNINRGSDGRYWLGLVSPRSEELDMMSAHPKLRQVVQRLPEQVRPKARHYGHVVAIDGAGKVLNSFQDPEGKFSFTTGAAEVGSWLYLSSLHEPNVARLKIQ